MESWVAVLPKVKEGVPSGRLQEEPPEDSEARKC